MTNRDIDQIGFLYWDLRPGTLDSPRFNAVVNDAMLSGLIVKRWRTGWFIRREHATAQGPTDALDRFSTQVTKLQAGSTEPWTRRRIGNGLSKS